MSQGKLLQSQAQVPLLESFGVTSYSVWCRYRTCHSRCCVGLASNDLILHLDVLQLVPEPVPTSWPLHDFGCGGEGKLENQVVIERLRVENSVVGKDGVVQVDAVLGNTVSQVTNAFF